MASATLGDTIQFQNSTDVIIAKNFTVDTNKTTTLKGNLNSQNSTVYLPTADKVFISGALLSSTISTSGVPIGAIAMWYDTANIPSGWLACNGTNSSNTSYGVTIPNLEGRFVICTSTTYPRNTSLGSATCALSITNFPSHTHGTFKTNDSGGHTHNISGRYADDSGNIIVNTINARAPSNGSGANDDGDAARKNTGSSGSHSHISNPSTSTTGTSTDFSIMPPYYSIIYIIKVF